MENNLDRKLEELIHRDLRELPEIQAPPTLGPRVLAAIQRRARRPWWQRPWTAWPVVLQCATLIALFGLLGFFFYGGHLAWKEYASGAISQSISTGLGLLISVETLVSTLTRALVLAGGSLNQVWLIGGTAVVLVMYLTCVGLGTVCFQMAAKKRGKEIVS